MHQLFLGSLTSTNDGPVDRYLNAIKRYFCASDRGQVAFQSSHTIPVCHSKQTLEPFSLSFYHPENRHLKA